MYKKIIFFLTVFFIMHSSANSNDISLNSILPNKLQDNFTIHEFKEEFYNNIINYLNYFLYRTEDNNEVDPIKYNVKINCQDNGNLPLLFIDNIIIFLTKTALLDYRANPVNQTHNTSDDDTDETDESDEIHRIVTRDNIEEYITVCFKNDKTIYIDS